MAIKFEWNPRKAKANLKAHGISFEEAERVWADTMALDEPDDRMDYGEDRSNRLGMGDDRLLVVTYTERIDNSGDEIIRIISARPAEPRERRRYHEA